MSPSRKNRLAIIVVLLVCISIVAIPLTWNFVEQNKDVVFSCTINDVNVYPSYYRSEVYMSGTAKPRFQIHLDTGNDECLVLFAFALYICDLDTFDDEFRIDTEEQDWEFRSEYLRESGAISLNYLQERDATLSDHDYVGDYVFVFWLESAQGTAPLKESTWTLSLTLTLYYV